MNVSYPLVASRTQNIAFEYKPVASELNTFTGSNTVRMVSDVIVTLSAAGIVTVFSNGMNATFTSIDIAYNAMCNPGTRYIELSYYANVLVAECIAELRNKLRPNKLRPICAIEARDYGDEDPG